MAFWNPSASCDQPEDSTTVATTPSNAGGRSFAVRDTAGAAGAGGGGGGGGRGGAGAGAGLRVRRIASRARATSEPSEVSGGGGGGGGSGDWRREADSRAGLERRDSDAGSRGGAGSAAVKARGKSAKTQEENWVQCDKCLRWRKLAPGMRNEDLPDKW